MRSQTLKALIGLVLATGATAATEGGFIPSLDFARRDYDIGVDIVDGPRFTYAGRWDDQVHGELLTRSWCDPDKPVSFGVVAGVHFDWAEEDVRDLRMLDLGWELGPGVRCDLGAGVYCQAAIKAGSGVCGLDLPAAAETAIEATGATWNAWYSAHGQGDLRAGWRVSGWAIEGIVGWRGQYARFGRGELYEVVLKQYGPVYGIGVGGAF